MEAMMDLRTSGIFNCCFTSAPSSLAFSKDWLATVCGSIITQNHTTEDDAVCISGQKHISVEKHFHSSSFKLTWSFLEMIHA